MNDRRDANLKSFSCTRCHQIVAVESAAGPSGWQFNHGLWVCGGCSGFDHAAAAAPVEQDSGRKFRLFGRRK